MCRSFRDDGSTRKKRGKVEGKLKKHEVNIGVIGKRERERGLPRLTLHPLFSISEIIVTRSFEQEEISNFNSRDKREFNCSRFSIFFAAGLNWIFCNIIQIVGILNFLFFLFFDISLFHFLFHISLYIFFFLFLL